MSEIKCPNCGGKVVSSLTIGEGDDAQTIEPEGNVGVCGTCHIAVSLDEEEAPQEEPLEEAPAEH